ncbi:sulfite oxidase [Rhodoligotrophos ferricapiens]|uniref:sulfite oxidase n=1 Tax=Rhodoligotrophos ferricapiens TaxID=3069264 RepID=UPI00315D55A9
MTDTSQRPAETARSSGRIVRQANPRNLETPVEHLRSFITPTDQFYIRNHFSTPRLDRAGYRLEITGAVDQPASLTYDELRALPVEHRVVTLECAGNGRVFLDPQAKGVQWALGAVSTAEWTGVLLADLLAKAGLRPDATEIILEGADRGHPKEDPKPAGAIAYARSLPLVKALSPDVLLAYQMNGGDLPLEHGFPVRAIVAGHYGMASVKWLTHIHASPVPFQGYWQTTDYAYWDKQAGHMVRRPLGAMKPKSIITQPAPYDAVAPGQSCQITGAAWTGEAEITQVLVSTDGGESWGEAIFLDPMQRHAWRRWSFDWQVPDVPGPCVLMSRAFDSSGAAQPDQYDPHYCGYVINQCLKIEVMVAADRQD